MRRLRLKADGRIVELTAQGTEAPLAAEPVPAPMTARDAASRIRSLRARAGLSQTQFAARLNLPVETIRNWEQGKRLPRGPARALLCLIERAPGMAFAALGSDAT
ncbi:MAG: helix-turn-helix domain-containing protein [Xanthobacteraceae bacterium]|nr:MAG: helix-turn-helix domain-containing protein [Xanthobacteraceae bacterium]